MKVRSLGHVVIKVRDQQRAEAFHNGLLGISIAVRYATPRLAAASGQRGCMRVVPPALDEPRGRFDGLPGWLSSGGADGDELALRCLFWRDNCYTTGFGNHLASNKR